MTSNNNQLVFNNDEENIDQIKSLSKQLSQFLSQYRWLADAYVLDFFVESHWNKLPEEWRKILNEIEPEDLSEFLNFENITFKCKKVWPLSLLAFRKVTKTLSWPRKCTKTSRQQVTDTTSGNIRWENMDDDLKNFESQYKPLHHVFRKGVKVKKQHEIYRCTKRIEELMHKRNCTRIVDVGAGQGHLSRVLSLGCGFKVMTIEAEGCHVTGARKRDQQATEALSKISEKYANCVDFVPPEHAVYFIPKKSTGKEILQLIKEFWKIGENDSKSFKFCLLGVHTCGNLASTILKMFAETEEACCLFSVGCCYMKMDSDGYPMSRFYSENLSNCHLSYRAKEVSCHALEMYSKRLLENASLLKIHCFRATLETLIVKNYPQLKHVGLKGVKNAHLMEFKHYVERALEKSDIKIPSNDLNSSIVNQYLNDWKKVVVFYSIRLLLAPVIETFILIDRWIYLNEKGFASSLISIFDPITSPRNIALISQKKE